MSAVVSTGEPIVARGLRRLNQRWHLPCPRWVDGRGGLCWSLAIFQSCLLCSPTQAETGNVMTAEQEEEIYRDSGLFLKVCRPSSQAASLLFTTASFPFLVPILEH